MGLRSCGRTPWIAGFLLCLAAQAAAAAPARPLEFQVSFDRTVSPAPFSGRVYVLLSKEAHRQPPAGPNWFNPDPFFARDVRDWKPGEQVVLGGDCLGFPDPLPTVPKGSYWAQAVMDFDRGERSFSAAEGNGYSRAVRVDLDPAAGGHVRLHIDQVFHARRFEESPRVKLVDIPSRLLSEFHGRPVRLRAGIVLPRSYAQNPAKRYPVVYAVPGFGGNHFMAFFAAFQGVTDMAGTETLYVVLDPSCRLGHHVFAESANNGPCGRALVEELIPHIEREFRALGRPGARFLTGHSSGGWSSLWLQITYPDFFGGVWSTAPDPVDFRDFVGVNLYAPNANLFYDEGGRPRPVARRDGRPVLFYKPFSDMEIVMGHGGQLGSFEAVFSPRGPDGKPKLLWDRASGKIDPEVARSWQRYDIRLVLERNWRTLGPKLAGKLHVYVGGQDTFYLDGAVALLKAFLVRLGSSAAVEIIPGRDHGNLLDRAMRQRIAREMAARFLARSPQPR
jgi:S-formylglutathione hydrolase FrmB